MRQHKRREKIHEELKYLGENEMNDAELNYLRAEALRAIYEAIETLPEQPRKVIRMAFIEGMKLPEIAAALNISYNTVQNHRAKGLELLRMHLVKNRVLSCQVVALALSILKAN